MTKFDNINFNPGLNKPYWDIVGAQILRTVYSAVNHMGVWVSLYEPSQVRNHDYDEWIASLNIAFVSLSGHLVHEEDDKYKQLYDDLKNHFYGSVKLKEQKLKERTLDLVEYLLKIGLSKIEVSASEDINGNSKNPNGDTFEE